VSEFGFITVQFTGRNGSGTISVPGLKSGDKVIWSAYTRSPAPQLYSAPGAFIDFQVTVDDQIEQIDTSNNSSATIDALIYRGG